MGESLLGVGAPRQLFERNIYDDASQTKASIHTVILVMISAIVFVVVIAMYDVVRNYIKDYYAKIELEDHRGELPTKDIVEAELANRENLQSSLVFALFCLVTGVILIPLLIILDQKI